MIPSLLLALTLTAPPPEPLRIDQVYALPTEQFVEQARRDLAMLRQQAQGLNRIQEQLSSHAALFKTRDALGAEQKETLLSAWGSLFSHVISAETIRQRYWDFVKVPRSD